MEEVGRSGKSSRFQVQVEQPLCHLLIFEGQKEFLQSLFECFASRLYKLKHKALYLK